MYILDATDTLEAMADVAAKVTVTVHGMTHTTLADVYLTAYQGQPGDSATTLYTVPASTQLFVKSITIANLDAAPRTITMWQAGNADTNVILPTVTLQGGEYATYGGDGWRFYDVTGAARGVGATGPAGVPGLTIPGMDGTDGVEGPPGPRGLKGNTGDAGGPNFASAYKFS
jgi:hypothetical protein